MSRILVLGLFTFTLTLGCGPGNDQPVIPTEIKQPPGPDSPEGGKGKRPKPADAKGEQSSTDR